MTATNPRPVPGSTVYSTNHAINDTPARLLTFAQVVERHPAFTLNALNALYYRSAENGFGICVRRIGRRRLIDEVQFINWVADQTMEASR